MIKLYGDGIHDDTAAIQQRIDAGVCEVILPAPQKFYLISKSLELPSDFRLVLPRFAEIRLAAGSNCPMVKNKMVYAPAERLRALIGEEKVFHQNFSLYRHIWGYVDDYSPDHPCCNIELTGGIWNCNNLEQIPNPEQSRDFSVREFYGCGMLFYNVKNLKISSLTIKDPSQYGMTLDTVTYFTVQNITFDYNLGNPKPINMDGVHLDGNCHFGVIQNLKGACYDDLVAVNADEGTHGPITDIQINGLFAEDCHSAVRLLSIHHKVERIHISDVYGTYYQYGIGITKFYPGITDGGYDAITLENIYISKAIRYPHLYNPDSYVYSLIWISNDTIVKNLSIRSLHRTEYNNPIDTIFIGQNTIVDHLVLSDITTVNHTGSPMALLRNDGMIKRLSVYDVLCEDDERITGNGIIETKIICTSKSV